LRSGHTVCITHRASNTYTEWLILFTSMSHKIELTACTI
jgi:hypothetical protein